MSKAPITKEGFNTLNEELKRLVSIERPKIIQAISSARELGDLRENGDYHAAKERQSHVEGRIAYLEDKIARSEVIDVSKLSGERVVFGATVVLEDEGGQSITYRIVGDDEASIAERKISYSSPIARALIGKESGDEVTVKAPSGSKLYTIVDVLFK